jgi:glycosyltransferase involved in cell wall biosynthesis
MPRWLKRLLRPLIPDRVMARHRLRQHSLQVRTNVDVLVAGARRRRRWLGVTPDTYRVGPEPPAGAVPVPDDVVMLGDDRFADRAVAALVATGAEAAVVGYTTRPRLVGRRRAEPTVEPATVAAPQHVVDEVFGIPGGDLVGLVSRVRDAGRRLALVPIETKHGLRAMRADPVAPPVVVVLATVPLHDVGGGSRSAQLARELLRRGVAVVYVAAFGSDEGTDLGLRFVHPRLEQYRLGDFAAEALASRIEEPGWVLVEVPLPDFGGALGRMRGSGWRVCYDIIDRWSDPALGGHWYDAAFEHTLVSDADAVVVSAPDLADLAAAEGREPVLIPNAVNADVFSRRPGALPDDFPPGGAPVIGYHGSLYGDWMDWEGLKRVAEARPEARVVIVGDASKRRPAMPENVHFLGLKPMEVLPDYVHRFDVGLVPFVVSPTTHAVSPLKVYEYLACGVPVAAPPLRSLDGLDGVVVDDDPIRAVDGALRLPRPDPAIALVAHSWSERVDRLMGLFGMRGAAAPAPMVLTRPVVHWGRDQRRL